jgi:hypothetical protein
MVKIFVMKKIIIALFFLAAIVSCKKDDQNLGFVKIYGIEDYEKAKDELKMYANYGVYTDGVAKLSVDIAPNTDVSVGEVFAKYRPEPDADRTDGGDYMIDDFTMDYLPDGFYQLTGGIQNNSSALGIELSNKFGKDVNFSLVRDDKKIFDENIYIPLPIKVSDFANNGLVDLTNYYGISRNDFKVNWNEDSNNKNGILVVLTWSGATLNSQLNQLGGGDFHYKAAWFEDKGDGSIPISFFEAVPNGATFTLEFVRAHIEIVTGTDGRSYKIYGISQDTKQCTLID